MNITINADVAQASAEGVSVGDSRLLRDQGTLRTRWVAQYDSILIALNTEAGNESPNAPPKSLAALG